MAGPGGGRGGVGAGIGGKKARARGISETVSCGDSGGRRRVLGTVGGSSACSGLAALSSCVRQGLLSLAVAVAVAVAVGLAVAEAKVGGLAFRPPGVGEEGLHLGCIP